MSMETMETFERETEQKSKKEMLIVDSNLIRLIIIPTFSPLNVISLWCFGPCGDWQPCYYPYSLSLWEKMR